MDMNLNRHRSGQAAILCAALMVPLTAACNRSTDETGAAAEKQAVSPEQRTATPMTVSGCLRAGDAADTFVLTAGQAAPGEQSATYQLVGLEGVNLRDHVGHRVEVQGVLNAQQQVASRSTTDPAPNATGTSGGTPSVSTETELQIRRLDVQQVKSVGEECRS
jgi:hypothetical protein